MMYALYTHVQNQLIVTEIGPLTIVNVSDQMVGRLTLPQGLILKQKEIRRHKLEVMKGEKIAKRIDDVSIVLNKPARILRAIVLDRKDDLLCRILPENLNIACAAEKTCDLLQRSLRLGNWNVV